MVSEMSFREFLPESWDQLADPFTIWIALPLVSVLGAEHGFLYSSSSKNDCTDAEDKHVSKWNTSSAAVSEGDAWWEINDDLLVSF